MFALIAGVVVIFGPLSIGLTKLVDEARNLFDAGNTAPKWTWPLLALALGLVVCLVFELNVMAEVLALIPRFSDSTILDGTVGQVVTAVGMAGMASYHHEHMDAKSQEAAANEATAAAALASIPVSVNESQ